MGMDLLAQNEHTTTDHYHLNWNGWVALGNILEELGCDLTSMAGYNDGDVVDATTSCDWAAALREGLRKGRIYKMEYPDASFTTGRRSGFHVDDTLTPATNGSYAATHILIEFHLDFLEPMVKEDLSERTRKVYINDGLEEYEWLSEIAAFFADSGGFEQW